MDTIELLQQEIEEMEKRIKTSQINTQQSVSAIPQSSQVLFSSQPLIDRLQLENRRLCSRDMKRKYALLLSDPLQKWSTTSNHSNNKHQNRINQELNGLLKDIYSASADCRVVSINTNDNNKKKWKSQKLLPEYQVYRQQSIMNTLKHRSRELERKYVCDVNKSVTGASEYPASVRFGSLVLPSNSNFEQKTVFMDIRQLSRLHSALVPVV